MIKIAKVVLSVLAVILIGFVCAVIGSIIVINLGYSFVPGFTYKGWQAMKPLVQSALFSAL